METTNPDIHLTLGSDRLVARVRRAAGAGRPEWSIELNGAPADAIPFVVGEAHADTVARLMAWVSARAGAQGDSP